MASSDPRLKSGPRKRLRAAVAALGLPCWRCGGHIDYTAQPGAPDAYHLDEVIARVDGGDPLDPSNVRPCCARCNTSAGGKLAAARRGRGTRTPTSSRPLVTSRDW